MLYVIDASVAAKWCLPPASEPLRIEAVELLNRYAKGQARFVVPDLFWTEVGNVLWKAVRVGRCTAKHAETSLAVLRERGLATFPSEGLIEQAFAIAVAFQRTVYDSLYVALAVESGGQLVTADEKLANALAYRLPVKWLGAV
ncbi:MAG TPA: type II toxin-antitoxin system VapC family toxin [Terriglobales bacterium]